MITALHDDQIFSSVTAFVAVVLVWRLQQGLPWFHLRNGRWNHQKGDQLDDDDGDYEDTSLRNREPYRRSPLLSCTPMDLPTHVQRELYKEERRELMRPLITMKNPMYDNIMMKDSDGKILSSISLKKAKWYVKKGLAKWEPNGSNETDETINLSCIYLLFQPATSDKDIDLQTYNASAKQNRCVVCGAKNDYMRHYVVPYCYRSLFPDHFKTHLPHDVVILCPPCHEIAEGQSHRRRKRLERAARVAQRDGLHRTSAQAELVDPYVHRVRSTATALLQWKARLPPAQIVAYEQLVRDWFRKPAEHGSVASESGSDDGMAVGEHGSSLALEFVSCPPSEAQLEHASKLECRRPNPHYVPGADLVIDSLKVNGNLNDEALADFVRDWRQQFVEGLHPRYLPKGWSVDAAVQNHWTSGVKTMVAEGVEAAFSNS